VARNIVSYAADGLAADLVASLRVFTVGWVAGTVSAALTGLALGRIGLLRRMFVPVIETIRPVSSIAWVPLSVVWFGFGLAEKVFLVGLAVFLVVVVYALDGARRIPPDLERTATMLGMNPWQRFLALVLPSTLVEVLIGARLALMAGWGTVIVAELVAADQGIGAHLVAVQQSYDVGAVVATMACFGVTGLVMNTAFNWIEARLVPWRPDAVDSLP
jgi:ABC-type nitrate/sulfonate/bicarbonate transport system permease component